MKVVNSLFNEFKHRNSYIVVVDNHSCDGSVTKLKQYISKNGYEDVVTLLESERNGGFGAGNNFAIRSVLNTDKEPDFFLLINPDALPSDGLITTFSKYLLEETNCGIIGGTIKRPDGEKKVSSFRYPNLISEFLRAFPLGILRKIFFNYLVAGDLANQTKEVDWISGSCMMIRPDVFRDIGLFDETYFLYYEEIDLCRRAKSEGWKIVQTINAGIIHTSGAITGIQNREKRIPKYMYHSRKHYFKKHHGIFYLWLANSLFIIGSFFNYIKKCIFRTSQNSQKYYIFDFIKNSF